MPLYRFEATDAAGKPSKGLLEADSERAVRTQLRGQGLIPLAVQPQKAGGRGWQREIWSAPALNGQAVATFTRQLGSLVGAGLTLERALGVLSEEADRPKARELIQALRLQVQGGSPFAQALDAYPRVFGVVYRAVVAAGEQSGALALVLQRLAADLEAEQTLRSKVWGAALYPLVVSVIALLMVVFLMTYVVPQVAQVYAGSKNPLPLLTRAMLGLSAAVRDYGGYALVLLLLAALACRLALKRPALRLRFDAWCLQLPVLGRLLGRYHSARFAATLALLVGAGVPILKALQTALNTLGNRALQSDAQEALGLVREGAPLALALGQKKRFPSIVAMFARLGEQTGQLAAMLDHVAKQLSEEVQRRALALASVLEPLLTVLMGGVVMLIVLAVLLPIIELNQLVK